MPSRRAKFPGPVAVFSDELLLATLDNLNGELGNFQPGVPFASPYTSPHVGQPWLLSIEALSGFEYIPFANDHGPLNINVVWKVCRLLATLLRAPSTQGRPICLFSSSDPCARSNMACVAACYVLLTSQANPWDLNEALRDLELQPFRDAGRGPSEWAMSVQDVLWGLWRAQEHSLLDMSVFDSQEYEYYEKVENGDFNVLGPFIAFASPVMHYKRQLLDVDRPVPRANPSLDKVLSYFEDNDVRVVVRLNEELYDQKVFTDRGMQHVEMFFVDGSNPSTELIRRFIKLADKVIEGGKKVAVHCKAGLGRTGVLIGAYLIYKHGFSASEAIAYMRVIRPGMVVGPQQVFMHIHAAEWRGWGAVDEYLRTQAKPLVSLSRIASRIATPGGAVKTPRHRSAFDEDEGNPIRGGLLTPDKALQLVDQELSHMRTPGQPRKTPSIARTTRAYTTAEPDQAGRQESADEDRDVPTAKRSKVLTRIPSLMSPVQRQTLLISPASKSGLVKEKSSPSKKGKPTEVISRPLPQRGALLLLAAEPQHSPARSAPRKASSGDRAKTSRSGKLDMRPAHDLFSPNSQ